MATNEKVTFNRLITDKAEGLMEDQNDFVAGKAFGVATAEKRMGEYPIFKLADMYRNSLKKRGVGAQYAETATDLEMRGFVCADYGVEEPVADETVAEMGAGYKQSIGDKLMIEAYRNYEEIVCGYAFDNTVWETFTGAQANNFSAKQFAKFNVAGINVSETFRGLKEIVKKNCGRKPNTALMTNDVMDVLLENDFIRDLIATTRDQIIDETFLAKVLGLDNIYVTEAILNGNGHGLDANNDFLYNGKLFLYWDGQAGRNSITAPCAMKVIRVNYGDINSASGFGIYERRDESRDTDFLRVKQRFVPVQQYKEAGLLLTECI